MADDIVAALKLAGIDEIIAQLERLGDQGEKSFNKLEEATKAVKFTAFTSAVKDVGSAFEGVNKSVLNLVNTVGSLVGLNFGGSIADTLSQITKSGTSAAGAVGSFSRATGIAFEEASNLSTALGAFGVRTDDLAGAMRRLSTRIQSEWPQVVKAIRDAGDAAIKTQLDVQKSAIGIQSANIALRASYLGVQNAVKDLTRFDEDAATKRKQVDQSVRSAEIGLIEARTRLNQLTGGPEQTQEQKERLDIAKAKLAVEQAEVAVTTARRAKERQDADEQVERENKLTALTKARIEVQNALIQAQLAPIQLRDAQKKELEDLSNAVPRLVEFIDVLTKGGDTTKFDNLNKSADNLVKGILGSMPNATKALQNFEGGIGDITAQAPEVQEVLFKIGDVFRNIEDASTRTALKMMLFGRNVPEAFIKFLSQGSDAVKKQVADNERLGLSFSEADEKASKAFKIATNSLDTTIQLMRDKVGVLFAPLTTSVASALNERLKQALPTIRAFFEEAVKQIQPFFTALGNVIRGVKIEDFLKSAKIPEDQVQKVRQWQASLEQFRDKLANVGEELRKFFFDVLPKAIGLVGLALDALAAGFSKLTGIKVSGEQMGLLVLLGNITGINAAVVDLIKSVGLLVIAFGALAFINPFAAALVGIVLLITAIALVPEAVQDMFKSILTFILGPFRAAFELLPDIIGKPLIAALDFVASTIEKRFNDLVHIVRAAMLTTTGDFQGAWEELKQIVFEKPKSTQPGFFEDIKKGIDDFLKTIETKTGDSTNKTGSTLDKLKNKSKEAFSGISDSGIQAAKSIETAYTKTADVIDTKLGNSQIKLKTVADTLKNFRFAPGVITDPDAQDPSAAIKRTFRQAPSSPAVPTNDLSAAEVANAQKIVEAVNQNTEATKEVVTATREEVAATTADDTTNPGVEKTNETLTTIQSDITIGNEKVTSALELINSTFSSGFEKLFSVLQSGVAPPSNQSSGSGGIGSDARFALGGTIPGTGSQDNVPILATPGEFMHPVRAVQHYGIAFMEAIRTLRLPRFALGGLVMPSFQIPHQRLALPIQMANLPQRFALGGLIETAPRLAFANGGQVQVSRASASSGRPVQIVLRDGSSFNLSGSNSEVSRLERKARFEEITSTGRQPNRVR